LFPDYLHFHEARLFKQSDDAYILEISYVDAGKINRNREPKTQRDILALQKNIADAVRERSPSIMLDQSSLTKFLIFEGVFAFLFYAPYVTISAEPSTVQAGTGIYLVVGGLSFLLPFILTKNAPMTDGESSLALGGAFLGLGHG